MTPISGCPRVQGLNAAAPPAQAPTLGRRSAAWAEAVARPASHAPRQRAKSGVLPLVLVECDDDRPCSTGSRGVEQDRKSVTDAGVGRSRSRAGLSSSRSSGPRCALQSCAVLTAATFLSACGGSSQSPQQDVPPAEAGAIAAAQACFQQEGYRVRLDANGMGMAVSGDGNESAHIEFLQALAVPTCRPPWTGTRPQFCTHRRFGTPFTNVSPRIRRRLRPAWATRCEFAPPHGNSFGLSSLGCSGGRHRISSGNACPAELRRRGAPVRRPRTTDAVRESAASRPC
jgi:hypothetical protein